MLRQYAKFGCFQLTRLGLSTQKSSPTQTSDHTGSLAGLKGELLSNKFYTAAR
ncbi:hypothetical protein BS78_01G195700 [Paspalum vaginatum]|nr:hypothetical protein BS78_01G195700 [Paspalum vaginatum]